MKARLPFCPGGVVYVVVSSPPFPEILAIGREIVQISQVLNYVGISYSNSTPSVHKCKSRFNIKAFWATLNETGFFSHYISFPYKKYLFSV
jgi:hypothetical protein